MVKVEARDSGGRAFTSDGQTITVIPAGKTFVVGGSLIWNVSVKLARITVVVHVKKTAPRARTLPRVKHVVVSDKERSRNGVTHQPIPETASGQRDDLRRVS